MPATVPNPIHLAPATAPAPTSYMVLRQSQRCRGCGRTHEWTEVYAKTNLRPQMDMGRYVTNLRPVNSPADVSWNLPIEYQDRPTHEIPFCHACHSTTKLTHLPSPPPPQARSAILSVAKTSTSSAPAAKKPKFGVDDL